MTVIWNDRQMKMLNHNKITDSKHRHRVAGDKLVNHTPSSEGGQLQMELLFQVEIFQFLLHFETLYLCQMINKQESIPVGCVPSAAVAAGGGRVCFPGGCASRGCASGGMCFPGGCASWEVCFRGGVSQHALGRQAPPPPCEQNHRCL